MANLQFKKQEYRKVIVTLMFSKLFLSFIFLNVAIPNIHARRNRVKPNQLTQILTKKGSLKTYLLHVNSLSNSNE